MNNEEVLEIARQALLIAIQMGSPILIIGLVVGVSIALIQALTQIQEITLVFVPKILAILLSMFFFLPWMMTLLMNFMEALADKMIGLG